MSNRTLFLIGVLFCGIAVASAGKGKGGKWKEMLRKCQDDEVNMEDLFKVFKECKKEEQDKQGDTPTQDEEELTRRRRSPNWGGGKGGKKWEKKMCAGVCTLKKEGVLDGSGQFNEAGAKEFVDKVYPEKYRSDALDKIKKCSEDHSSKFSMDDNCKGYMEFMKCVKEGHKTTCGIEWKKGKGKGKGKPKQSDDEAADEE